MSRSTGPVCAICTKLIRRNAAMERYDEDAQEYRFTCKACAKRMVTLSRAVDLAIAAENRIAEKELAAEVAYRAELEKRAKEEDADPMRVGMEYSSGVGRQTLGAPNIARQQLEALDARKRVAQKRAERLKRAGEFERLR